MTADIIIPLAVMAGGIWCVLGLYWLWIAGRIPRLQTSPPIPDTWPSVSLVITACDEEDTIERAFQSLLQLDYPHLEIIAVNDRSTDTTGAILERLAVDAPHVRVVHIETLPEGWLGKVHAMHSGAEASTGQWILFADADVIFSPDIIRRAVAHAESQDLDHFSLIPKMEPAPLLLDATVTGFVQLLVHQVYGFRAMPFGAGAFNMARRRCLEASEGLAWLKMEIADDSGLAWLITEAGGRSAAATALQGLRLRWYPTLSSMFRGLEKNAAIIVSQGRPYRVYLAWFAGMAVLHGPWLAALFWAEVWPAVGAGYGLLLLATARLKRRMQTPVWRAALAPIGLSLVLTAGLWSMVQIRRNDGISWRGTRYGWEELVAGQRVKV